ncbi:MAG: cysteine hydrolase [Bacteroidales bacterium]|nr:cysteine hydrolase [Bacteroidales bacterium]HPD95838.1 isochorismatase family cysteine hydrolase [Tenuifilaceae bacterium]
MKAKILMAIILTFTFYCGMAQNEKQSQDKYLIVLDIQQHFTEGIIPNNEAAQLISTINSIIATWDKSKIIYVKSVLTTLNISAKGFKIDTLPQLEFDKRLNVVNNNIVLKNKANAFKSTELTNLLKQNQVKDIVVVGLMAEHCVYQTLIGGKKLGYHMHVIPEAVAGKTTDSKMKIMSKLAKKGINTIHLPAR